MAAFFIQESDGIALYFWDHIQIVATTTEVGWGWVVHVGMGVWLFFWGSVGL